MSAAPTLISVSNNGQNANEDSYFYSASLDGRYVVFGSDATNLTAIDGSGRNNFLRDTVAGWTINIDISPEGVVASSADWRGIASQSPVNPLQVAFTTDGFGDGFNLYVRDVSSQTTRLIAEDISKTDYPLSFGETWHWAHFGWSADGASIVYASADPAIVAGDTNNYTDIFIENVATGVATRVNVSQSGVQANGHSYNPTISEDGRFVAFWTYADNLGPTDSNSYADVYVKDLLTGEIKLITQGLEGAATNGNSVVRGFSSDGKYLLLESAARNLVAGDTNSRIDVFAANLQTGEVTLISRTATAAGNGHSVFSNFVPGTDIVSFVTFANNLLTNDTNGVRDPVFSRIGSNSFETLDYSGPVQPNDDVRNVGVSGDGNYAYLVTEATNLTPGDTSSDTSIVRVPLAQILQALAVIGDANGNLLQGTTRADYVRGLAGSDTLLGYDGDDLLDGGGDSDMIYGGAGNDTMIGGADTDYLDGGSGTDTAAYSGNFAQYTLSFHAGSVLVSDLVGQRDGTDEVVRTEFLKFADRTLSLTDQTHAPVTFAHAGFAPGAGGWSSMDGYPRAFADVNGDGIKDIVGFGHSATYVALGTGNGNFATEMAAIGNFGAGPLGGSWVSDNIYPRELGDVNGDGRADIVGFGDAGVYVALGQGNGTFGAERYGGAGFGAGVTGGSWLSEESYPRELGDVNGDGRDDIVGFGGAGVYVALSIGDGTFAPGALVLPYFGSDAAGGGWASDDRYPRRLADIDGDGDDDLIGFGDAGVYTALSNSDGTFSAPQLAVNAFGAGAAGGGWASQAVFPRQIADLNGDGAADLIGFGGAGAYAAIADGTGGFRSPELILSEFGAEVSAGSWVNDDEYPRFVTDLNGDGFADIAGIGYAGVYVSMTQPFTDLGLIG